jgi:hypothetical protein
MNNTYQRYDLSNFGFLNNPDLNLQKLPIGFEEFTEAINALEITDGDQFRKIIDNLQKNIHQQYYIDKLKYLTHNEYKQIYFLFTFMAQKYVKCIQDNIREIPYEIGLIWYYSAEHFGLPCVMTYASTILYNCKFDKDGELTSIYSISGTYDELHFYKVHIQLEKCGANLLKEVVAFIDDERNLHTLLQSLYSTIMEITWRMNTMYDGCDPEIFWQQIRIFLSGYNDDYGYPNGLKVKDTELYFKFGGGSAAQSSLIQLIDIVLGVKHESEHGTKFLLDQRKYMPKLHREFLTNLEVFFGKKPMKDLVKYDDIYAKEYNDIIGLLHIFRKDHYRLVHTYIIKFINKKTNDELEENVEANLKKGVGGLMFKELTMYAVDTIKNKIKYPVDNIKYIYITNNELFWLTGTICIAFIFAGIFSNNI